MTTLSAESLGALEPWIRVGAFAGVFLAVAAWEALSPRRFAQYLRRQRWPHNLALFALDVAVVRIVAAGAVIAVAMESEARGWGVLNNLELPPLAGVVLAFLALDLIIYGQHVLFHRMPALWRLHRVHHSDPDFDLTTGSRFHPIEILLSLGIKCVVVAALGAPMLAVLLFEVVLNAAALFNHANGRLPAVVDRWLRWLIVTPDMHRVHHSVVAGEMNANFGFNLPWWDWLFGTYLDQPAAGHAGIRIGVQGFAGDDAIKLHRLLMQPIAADRRDRNVQADFQIVAGAIEIDGVPKQAKAGRLCADKVCKDFEAWLSSIKSGKRWRPHA
jgi:sterol desaturase/sphingolipid hydroxylase (fatty acid hydroxylase superfamily)